MNVVVQVNSRWIKYLNREGIKLLKDNIREHLYDSGERACVLIRQKVQTSYIKMRTIKIL